jgi:hypothetical protein
MSTIKFQFNDDIRRVQIDKDKFTYTDLLTRITSTYKTIPQEDIGRIVVRYLDNESDLCTITGNEELQEAFCSFSSTNLVLKLVISLKEEPKIEAPVKEDHPGCKWRDHAKNWKEHHGQAHPGKEHPGCKWKDVAGKCPARKIFRDGMILLEETKYEAARDVFIGQLKEVKSEWQQRIPCYYIACCESQLGNTASALEYLEKAVNYGFRNLYKIKEDPNLNAIRSSEKFNQLLAIVVERKECKSAAKCEEFKKKMNFDCQNQNCEGFKQKCHWKKLAKINSSPSISKEINENEAKAEIAPLVIERTEKPVEIKEIENPVPYKYEKTLATLEEMGFLNRDQNIEALNKVHGDAKLAISVILGL